MSSLHSMSTLSFQHGSAGSEPRLHRLFSESASYDKKYRNTIVVIPDFDVLSIATTWQDGWKNCWLQTRLPTMLENPCVLSFEPGLGSHDRFSWQDIAEWGDILLRELLLQTRIDRWFEERPLFFVAHGVGGLLLKRAIGVLFERSYDAAYRSLIFNIMGIVFLGCPSPAPYQPRDLDKLSTLLKAVSKLSGKTLHKAEKDVLTAANVSQRFSDTGFDAPVLSIYEEKPSKVGKNIFAARQILVDRSLCETMTRRERLLGIECSHADLCNLKLAVDLESELTQFISLALDLRNTDDQSRSGRTWPLTISDEESSGVHDGPQSRASGDLLQVPSDIPSSSKPRRETLPCYLFPSTQRNPRFVGRGDVLNTLDKALLPSADMMEDVDDSDNQSRLKTFALCGVGGLGKTQIALEYIYSRKDKFDAVFWIHAADTARLANDFAEIAIRLGLEKAENVRDQTVARNLVLGWLSSSGQKDKKDKPKRTERMPRARATSLRSLSATAKRTSNTAKWLLVFDNANTLADLRDYWPVSGVGSILVTSRDPLAKTRTYFHSPNGVDLEPFTTEESAQWLRKLTKYEEPEDFELSETIVSKLSNLPLAISQVAAAILRQRYVHILIWLMLICCFLESTRPLLRILHSACLVLDRTT